MKERRYKSSYRIVTDVDPKTGRPAEKAVYAGEYYRFAKGSPAPRALALRVGACAALFWLAALLYLGTARATSRCMYALVPIMASLLPGAYLLSGVWATLKAPARMTIVQKENGPGRLVRASLGCGALAGISAAGCAICLSLGGLWARGWHEPLLAALAAAAGWVAFALSRRAYRLIEAVPHLQVDEKGV